MENEYDDENMLENADDDEEDMANEENISNSGKDDNTKNGDGEKGSGPPNIQPRLPGTKQKRRSKNDNTGRDYVCGCGKTYLSYPALYTHIKTKHNGKTPEGTNANQVQNGRGRGRPRKNFLINEDSEKRTKYAKHEVCLDEKIPEMKDYYRKDNLSADYIQEKEEIYYNIYKALGLLGGPTDPMEGFPDFNNKNLDPNLKKAYEPIYNKIKYIMDNNLIEKLLQSNTANINKITCDDIIALFLIENSKIVTPKFYKILVIFMKLYRECMNKLGWEILSQYKDLIDEPTNLDYTTVKSGEHLPDISNDFINVYLHYHLPDFDKYLAVVLVNHFCDWLCKFRFTHTKLKFMENGKGGEVK